MVLLAPAAPSIRNRAVETAMPTLFRFLAVIAIIAGVIYGSMLALALLIQPQSREITVTIPQDRFSKQR